MDFLPDIEKFKNFFDGTDSKNEISIAVEEAKKYDIFNLISRVSALNLFHQNQTKSVILDTYIEGVLCQTRDVHCIQLLRKKNLMMWCLSDCLITIQK